MKQAFTRYSVQQSDSQCVSQEIDHGKSDIYVNNNEISFIRLLAVSLVWFVLVNDTWSQDTRCHVYYNHIFINIYFLNLQLTISDIRPHIKLTVRLVIAYGHFNLPPGFARVCMVCVSMHSPNLN